MADDLASRPEFVVEFRAEDGERILVSRTRVQAVGDNKEDVLFFYTCAVQVLQNVLDRQFAVAGRLFAALYAIGNDENDFAAPMDQLFDRLHTDRVVKTFAVGCLEPVVRDISRIWYRNAGDEFIGGIRQVGAHRTGAVFKFKMFHKISFSPKGGDKSKVPKTKKGFVKK